MHADSLLKKTILYLTADLCMHFLLTLLLYISIFLSRLHEVRVFSWPSVLYKLEASIFVMKYEGGPLQSVACVQPSLNVRMLYCCGCCYATFFSPKHIVMKLIDTGRRRREPANI